jgi:excisionase family DNA binding protein
MVEADMMPIAVKIETAARLIDTPATTVLFWVKRGRLPARKVGRSYRVLVADLKALVEGTEP